MCEPFVVSTDVMPPAVLTRLLADLPPGNVAARAVLTGLPDEWGVTGTLLYLTADPGTLVAAGSAGVPADRLARIGKFSVRFPHPLTDAYRDLTAVAVVSEQIPSGWWGLPHNGDVGAPGARVVFLPLTSRGTGVGMWCLEQDVTCDWGISEHQVAQAYSGVLALWMMETYRPGREADEPKIAARLSTGVLTERQVEILLCLENGKSNSAIASDLGYAPATVKKDVQHVLAVLGVHDRQTAVSEARRRGVI